VSQWGLVSPSTLSIFSFEWWFHIHAFLFFQYHECLIYNVQLWFSNTTLQYRYRAHCHCECGWRILNGSTPPSLRADKAEATIRMEHGSPLPLPTSGVDGLSPGGLSWAALRLPHYNRLPSTYGDARNDPRFYFHALTLVLSPLYGGFPQVSLCYRFWGARFLPISVVDTDGVTGTPVCSQSYHAYLPTPGV